MGIGKRNRAWQASEFDEDVFAVLRGAGKAVAGLPLTLANQHDTAANYRERASWRRRWDSNPRCRFCPHTPLAGEHLRPLGHVSGPGGRDSSACKSAPVRCDHPHPATARHTAPASYASLRPTLSTARNSGEIDATACSSRLRRPSTTVCKPILWSAASKPHLRSSAFIATASCQLS